MESRLSTFPFLHKLSEQRKLCCDKAATLEEVPFIRESEISLSLKVYAEVDSMYSEMETNVNIPTF